MNHYNAMQGVMMDPPPNALSVCTLIEAIRGEVRLGVLRFVDSFVIPKARLAACISLKDALHQLELKANEYDYEPLSRVAAVLHDTLKNNNVLTLDEIELGGFVKACEQATE